MFLLLQTTMVQKSHIVLQETASPDTPIKDVVPTQDAGHYIMKNTLDQSLGHKLGKVYQGMGNARHCDTSVSYSSTSMRQVATLTVQVASLEQQLAAHTTHIKAHDAYITARETRITHIIHALQLFDFQFPDLAPPPHTTTQPLNPAHTQPTDGVNLDDFDLQFLFFFRIFKISPRCMSFFLFI